MKLHELGARELLAGYRSRAFSPVEVAQAVLDHVARWEPHLHASYLLRPELALEQARASEARWQKGEPCGALDGVPRNHQRQYCHPGRPGTPGHPGH